MPEFKEGDRVLIDATLSEIREHGSVFVIRRGISKFFAVPADVRPFTDTEQPAAHPLDAAIAELGRVTGLSGDDLLTAAERAVYLAAHRILCAAAILRKEQATARAEVVRAIGEVMPSVIDHAVFLDEDPDPF